MEKAVDSVEDMAEINKIACEEDNDPYTRLERIAEITDGYIPKLTDTEKREKFCPGCYNDDYNQGLGGAKACWCMEGANIIMSKEVHINQRPPWTQEAKERLSCYRKPKYHYPKGENW